jgi:hypothetical protein
VVRPEIEVPQGVHEIILSQSAGAGEPKV